MAARNGSEFLGRLAAARVHVEIQGETLTGGVAAHPAFRNVVRSFAELYDMQHDPAYRDILTYPSPATGEPVATAFLTPTTPAHLAKRRGRSQQGRGVRMPARTGTEFLQRLASTRRHVEIQGETLTGGVAAHPAFRNVVRSFAELYDMQHDPAYRDILTYPSPATGEPVATAFLTPTTPAHLAKRRDAFKLWADRSFGMLGRTGDYLDSYDMQHDPAYRDILTYPSPATGEPVATAFLTPTTPAHLAKRRDAFKLWADRSFGMLGRTGDYLDSALMALASAEDWFAQAGAHYARRTCSARTR